VVLPSFLRPHDQLFSRTTRKLPEEDVSRPTRTKLITISRKKTSEKVASGLDSGGVAESLVTTSLLDLLDS
jgi:hypothetical protein